MISNSVKQLIANLVISHVEIIEQLDNANAKIAELTEQLKLKEKAETEVKS